MADVDHSIEPPRALVVMPFGTMSANRDGIRELVDFDRIWTEVLGPVLAESLNPIRVDQAAGPHVVSETIARLSPGDIVFAEVTAPDVGLYRDVDFGRATRLAQWVLLATEWASPSFDFRRGVQLRYPLPSGQLNLDSVREAREILRSGIAAILADRERTDLDSADDYLDRITVLSRRADELRTSGDGISADLEALHHDYPAEQTRSLAMAWIMLELTRDGLGMPAVLSYIDRLPEHLQRDPDIQEQRALALGKLGEPAEAAAALERLIHEIGQTGERCGILGGRYKELWRSEGDPSRADLFLRQAISAYENGMYADLNEYYCASNLPRLYRSLAEAPEDLATKTAQAAAIAIAACERARNEGRDDGWTKPTLLGIAFELGNLERVQSLSREIQSEDWASWKLDILLEDLRTSVQHHEPNLQAQLLDELRTLEALTDQ